MPRRPPTYKELAALVKQQAREIASLKAQLELLKTRKNSRNSSIAPSKDENRPKPNQSLRKSSGKKPGGQFGRKGKTLDMESNPDKVVELHPDYCRSCGASLSGVDSTKQQSRQVVDIPPIQAVYTEYQTFAKVCACGCNTLADFPKGVEAPISYGSNTEALIGYFHTRQYLPFGRMQELFNDVFNLPISEGGIHYLLNRFADKTTPLYDIIKQRVAASPVVGSDETGVKVNGDKHWFWTWQTPCLTFIAHSQNRGSATINQYFPNSFADSTLVHDGWKPQLNTLAKNHQSCLPHLVRRLKYLNEKYNHHWGASFRDLLLDAWKLKNEIITTKEHHYNIKRTEIIQRLQALLDKPPEKTHKELFSFYKRMDRERQHLFTFLFLKDVPPDNNASERAIRNVKIKQKISGQFKIPKAAQNFAKIRSVIDTTIKNRMNVLQALNLIAKFEFQL